MVIVQIRADNNILVEKFEEQRTEDWFSLFNGISTFVNYFNAKAIFIEGQ